MWGFALSAKVSLDFETASRTLTSKLLNFFNVPEGKIAHVVRNKAWVSIPSAKPLKPGLVLVVYRPGKPIVDKETGQVFPGIDEPVALFKIEGRSKGYYYGTLKSVASPVHKGYKVRLPEVIKIFVDCSYISNAAYGKSLCDIVKLSIAQEPKFSVVDSLTRDAFTYVVMPKVIEDPSGRVKLSYLLKAPSSKVEFMAFSSDVRAVKSVSTAMLLQGNQEVAGRWAKYEGLIASRVFTDKFKLLSAADFDGDGKWELVAASDGMVKIFRLKGKEFIPVATYSLGRRGEFYRFLRIYTLDIDGDKVPEIYVSCVFQDIVNGQYKAYASSFVLKYKEGKLKKVADFDYLLRVADIQGSKVLLGQKVGEYEAFSGPIFAVRYVDGHYRIDKRVPASIKKFGSLYGWAIGDVTGDGKPELVVLDDDLLEVETLNGTLIWESEEPLGPFTHLFFYQTPRFVRIPAMKNYEPEEVAVRRIMPRKLELKYFPQEERTAILTVANDEKKFFIAGIKIFTEYDGINGRVVKVEKVSEGTLYSSYFDVVWETPKSPVIYGQDFAVGDFNGDGVLDLAFLGYLKKSGKTRVDIYKLPGM